MMKDKYPVAGIAIVVGSALAIWAGMPPVYLLFLACPVMMLFMMSGMNSNSRHNDNPAHGDDDESSHATRPNRSGGPRNRIERP